jgi:hypothetical protein
MVSLKMSPRLGRKALEETDDDEPLFPFAMMMINHYSSSQNPSPEALSVSERLKLLDLTELAAASQRFWADPWRGSAEEWHCGTAPTTTFASVRPRLGWYGEEESRWVEEQFSRATGGRLATRRGSQCEEE